MAPLDRTSLLPVLILMNGAYFMALEITGKRLLIPYLGSDVYTWTTLLMVSLFASGVGYHLSSRIPRSRIHLLGWSHIVFNACLPLMAQTLGPPLARLNLDGPALSLIMFILFISFPLVVSCIYFPYLSQAISGNKSIHKSFGDAFTLSSIGGVLGCFISVFLMSDILSFSLSTQFLIWSATQSIVVLGAGGLPRAAVHRTSLGMVLFLLAPTNISLQKKIEVSVEAVYETVSDRILVFQKSCFGSPDLLCKYLSFGNRSYIQGGLIENREKVEGFSRVFKLPLFAFGFNRDIQSILLLGLGAGITASEILNVAENFSRPIRLKIIEIEPQMVEIAVKHFRFPEADPRLSVSIQDARRYLYRDQQKFDLIFLDTEIGLSKSAHLVTIEAMDLLRDHLTESGILVINLISSFRPIQTRSALRVEPGLAAVAQNLRHSFPEGDMKIYELNRSFGADQNFRFGNVLLLASKTRLELSHAILQVFDGDRANQPDSLSHIHLAEISSSEYQELEEAQVSALTDNSNSASFTFREVEKLVRRTGEWVTPYKFSFF